MFNGWDTSEKLKFNLLLFNLATNDKYFARCFWIFRPSTKNPDACKGVSVLFWSIWEKTSHSCIFIEYFGVDVVSGFCLSTVLLLWVVLRIFNMDTGKNQMMDANFRVGSSLAGYDIIKTEIIFIKRSTT